MPKFKITVLKRMAHQDLVDEHWDDIYKVFVALANGGNFGGWMKETDRIVACCSDGLRPVVFEVRRVEA